MGMDDLALAQLHAGMVLSDDVRDADGQILMTRGTVLTPALLATLPRLGIAALPVHADAGAARVDYLFRKLDPAGADAWAAMALRDHLHAYRTGAAQ